MAAKSNAAAAAPRASSAAVRKKPRTISIGNVLKELQVEFPDLSVSKLRFLESEGLVTPQRSPSGYRRFSDHDIDRIRYVLRVQRDNYTPLKVIREQLESIDSGDVSMLHQGGAPLIAPEQFRAKEPQRLTDDDLCSQAAITLEFLQELVRAKIIAPDLSGFFTIDDVRIASTAHALTDFGLDVRHLKTLRNASQRQADIIAQAVAPIRHSKDLDAQQRAVETSQNMASLVVSMHATMVKAALRDELGA